METLDEVKVRQVWSRVRGETPAGPDYRRLPALIASEEEAADTYLQLSRKLPGKERLLLQRMSQEEQAGAAAKPAEPIYVRPPHITAAARKPWEI